jgi:hypothetical protein
MDLFSRLIVGWAAAKDSQAERFRRVWRAVVETSPIKRPL